MHPSDLFILVLISLFSSLTESNEEKSCSHGSCSSTLRPSWSSMKENIDKAKEIANVQCQDANNPELWCAYKQVIDSDLAGFDDITTEMLEETRKAVTHPVTYQLIGGRLFRSKDCLFPARCDGIEHFLLKLAPKLPDFELVLNNHDWPFISKHFNDKALPLFSFSKTQGYSDIFYPAWTFWAGGPSISKYPTGLGRWDLMRDRLEKKAKEVGWNLKETKAFFRGSRTSGERDNLVLLSRKKPDLVDAKYTKNQAWRSKADSLGVDPVSEVDLDDHCNFKYLFNFRGVAASFRYKHLFMCGSVVLHVGSEWLEFFYSSITPWYHYIPVHPRSSQQELQDVIEFLKNNEDIAKAIAENGQAFIRDHLRMEDVENYWTVLLQKYAAKLNFKPTRNNSYHEIKPNRRNGVSVNRDEL